VLSCLFPEKLILCAGSGHKLEHIKKFRMHSERFLTFSGYPILVTVKYPFGEKVGVTNFLSFYLCVISKSS
jgi:hypothetical protein